MNKVFAVGIGPGSAEFLTQQARAALEEADLLCGYTTYLDLVRDLFPDKPRYATPMTKERDRCLYALEQAAQGRTVAMVCSGDAGVYGMASLLLELAPGFPGGGCHLFPDLGHGLPHLFQRFFCHLAQSSSV